MALNARQTRLYTDTCDLWQRTDTVAADGTPTEVWTRTAQGVQYYHQVTPNVSDVTDTGRTTRPTVFTTDTAHFDAAQALPSDAGYLKNTTSGSPLSGKVFAILGAPEIVPNRGNRRANKQSVPVREPSVRPAAIT